MRPCLLTATNKRFAAGRSSPLAPRSSIFLPCCYYCLLYTRAVTLVTSIPDVEAAVHQGYVRTVERVLRQAARENIVAAQVGGRGWAHGVVQASRRVPCAP